MLEETKTPGTGKGKRWPILRRSLSSRLYFLVGYEDSAGLDFEASGVLLPPILLVQVVLALSRAGVLSWQAPGDVRMQHPRLRSLHLASIPSLLS